MKKILLILAVAFTFTACNKCKECTHDNYEYTTYDSNGNYETHGDQIMEVCSDNFESKDDFKSYIDAMEDDDWECKSDFWN
ncbi:MAG: hypothetical protein H8E84_03520 [Flavobacteriales bacterium]|nr:hypothetical protein [Flavobacteriales bacterium]